MNPLTYTPEREARIRRDRYGAAIEKQDILDLLAELDETRKRLAEATATERERCAKVVERYIGNERITFYDLAAAIRRGE